MSALFLLQGNYSQHGDKMSRLENTESSSQLFKNCIPLVLKVVFKMNLPFLFLKQIIIEPV